MRVLRALCYFSLVYGGFLVIAYLVFAYYAVWQHEFLPGFPGSPPRVFEARNGSMLTIPPGRARFSGDPLSQVLSLPALLILFTGIVFLVNGYYLQKYLRQKENKETKRFVISSLLTDEEKTVYDELIKRGGEATQKQLSASTGFSAVKTYRTLQRLEKKNIIKAYPFGMTKKIILREE
ncbi:hypothetical protein HY991_04545 [Candidatus Micrarchaeota archaeon]|nr:hypothetical protein [Candidatus Micrarchaeota archaeon]